MSHWLFKSEPDVWGWDHQVAKGEVGEEWHGVRNYQARNNMRAMKVGDLGFFYHSNIGKEVVGVLRVIAPAHLDPSDDTGTWECVDIRAVRPLTRPAAFGAAGECGGMGHHLPDGRGRGVRCPDSGRPGQRHDFNGLRRILRIC